MCFGQGHSRFDTCALTQTASISNKLQYDLRRFATLVQSLQVLSTADSSGRPPAYRSTNSTCLRTASLYVALCSLVRRQRGDRRLAWTASEKVQPTLCLALVSLQILETLAVLAL